MVRDTGRRPSQWKQWLAAMAAVLPIVIVGFLGILVNVTMQMLRKSKNVPEEVKRSASLLTILGCLIGALLGSISADRFGRKKTLLATLICGIGGTIGILLPSPASGCIILLIGGINAGVACTVVPLYISEIADDNIRGRLLMLQLLGIYIGQFIVTTAAFMLEIIVIDIYLIVIPLIFVIAIYWFPESPYHLASTKQYQELAKSLAFFRGIDQVAAEEEAQVVISSVEENGSRKGLLRKVWEIFQGKNRKGFIIVALLIILQWDRTFIDDKADRAIALQNVMSNSLIHALMIMSAAKVIWSGVLVFTIDIIGRRRYLLGSTLVGLIIAVFATSLIMDRSYIFFLTKFIHHLCEIVIFGIPLVFVGELFPANVRSTVSCMVVIFGTLCKSVFSFIDWSTPGGSDYDFWLFIPIYLLAFLLVLAFVPETKKNSISDIQDALADTRLICRRN